MTSSILLDTLKTDLDQSYRTQLDSDPEFYKAASKYLQDLLVNDELLSTDAFTTTTTTTPKRPTRTIVEEIAELDSARHNISLQLSSLANANRDLILDVNSDLDEVQRKFATEYQQCIDSILKNLDSAPSVHHNRNHHHHRQNQNHHDKTQQSHQRLLDSIKQGNMILSNMDSVLDILELPTLCKLCILQGNYQESLDISIFAKSLTIRFPKLQIFKAISIQVQAELQVMLKGLIKLLNTDLRQNHILKIFQILNKLESVDDKSLQRIYLNSRFKFILDEISSLTPILKFNKLTYLKRYVEIYREHVYAALSMYHTIFKEEENLLLLNQFITTLGENLCREFIKYLPAIKSQQQQQQQHGSIESEMELKNSIDGLLLQLIYLSKSLSSFQFEFEPIFLLQLCYKNEIFTEKEWVENMSKVKKHR
ncbi:uncharacterized protein LODBEIA_P49450 [Lodderomyces beijingensis]|uniref:Conserved oligomeric Golgi complex subunit 8 n=1 Tax=Lodderomyces beijingensis TaxID=1775926 RepID=A0ABP0ZRC9_9ASCO